MSRKATVNRKTTETQISVEVIIDGEGIYDINTPVPFLNHMLELFTKHGLFNISIQATGDNHIDDHHTVEDLGICLGQAFKEALGDYKGIKRYASGIIPMDEALTQIAVDISNRPHLTFKNTFGKEKIGNFDAELCEEFLLAFINNLRISCHIDILRGSNLHHMAESVFKGLGIILDEATMKDPRKKGVPSTKGSL